MAHQWLRCNLSSIVFPFVTSLEGRTVIVPQYDENYDWVTAGSLGTTRNKGIPEAFYMHNCMPSVAGYQSIGYDIVAQPVAAGIDEGFDLALTLQTPDLGRFIFSPASGKNYIYDATRGGWNSTSPFAAGVVPADAIITSAFVQGQSYLTFSKVGTFVYDDVNKVLVSTPLAGLAANDIKGTCSANGYQIAWDDTTLAWSNATNPADFVPSLITGAGGGQVADAKGRIILCAPISGGFIVYCEKNAVAARFTGNIRFPYILTEIPGSGGINVQGQVSFSTNLAEHYAWTTNGLQLISRAEAKNEFPEASDFLSSSVIEDFNEATLVFSQTNLTTPLNVRVVVISDRYIVCSIGAQLPDFTHAIIYDSVLKRWGKVKITHRSCFQWNAPNLAGIITYGMLGTAGLTYGQLGITTYGDLNTAINTNEVPRKTIAFLQKDGTVQVMNFDFDQVNAQGGAFDGVLLVGKFQFRRNNRIVHQDADIECVFQGQAFNYYVVPTNDGKTLLPPVKAFQRVVAATLQKWSKMVDGQNISALFVGAFHLSSFQINFTEGGHT